MIVISTNEDRWKIKDWLNAAQKQKMHFSHLSVMKKRQKWLKMQDLKRRGRRRSGYTKK